MAHPQQRKFIQLVQQYFIGTKRISSDEKIQILEIGSYDVNGSIRDFLQNAQTEYVGVDLCSGKGVDIVGYGHELKLPSESFDVAISCECFEHDPNWAVTFENMVRMTKRGGIVVFTCASLGRLEHGTIRSISEHSPGTQFVGLDYYKNLTKEDFYQAFDICGMFQEHHFFFEKSSYDLYFVGWKQGTPLFPREGQIDRFLAGVDEIKKSGKSRFKLVEIPTYIARAILPETRYQDFSCAYLQQVYPLRRFIKSIGRGKKVRTELDHEVKDGG